MRRLNTGDQVFAAIATAAALLLPLAAPAPARADPLITTEEAKRPPAKELASITRGMTRGPSIEAVQPQGSVSSPLQFKVRFTSHNNAPIDLASVKATYLSEPVVDLTERVRPYLSAQGIDFANAETPPGTHAIRVEIRDSLGRSSSAIIKLIVQ